MRRRLRLWGRIRRVAARPRQARQRRWLGWCAGGARAALALAGLALIGCAVPQPRGQGHLERLVEPSMRRGYWLYLPQEYVAADEQARQQRRWPVVVTMHGMKPFDSARPQAREWEQEADRYGFIVIAPELRAPDMFRQFPVRKVNASFKSDEEATLAILDQVFATTYADRKNVLATSWSSGGFLAHYMLNRYPDHFSCLAVRQSNFSASILEPELVSRSRGHPLLILTAQNDFGGVKRETQQAITWYEGHGYTNFAWVEIKGLGHERTPDTAAAFFAQVAGVEPNRPPTVLVRRQAIAGNPRGRALLAGRMEAPRPEPVEQLGSSAESAAAYPPTSPRAMALAAAHGEDGPATARSATPTNTRGANAEPRPARRQADGDAPPRSPMSIRVSSAIGTEPLVLAFSADCPTDWRRHADFLWTFNGDPICSGVNGQKTITQAGEHTLGLLVVTRDGREHRAYRLIRVLPQIESAHSSQASGG